MPVSHNGHRLKDWVVANDPVYAAVRHPGRMEKVVGGVFLLLAIAIVVFLLLFEWNWLRGPIGRYASAKYDRQIAIHGNLDVNLFSLTPSVEINDLQFGGPDWARDDDTARIGRIEASARLRKLLIGQVEMPRLTITRPRLVLLADAQGRESWALEPDKPDTGEGMKLPLIQQLIITDGQILFDDQKRGLTLDASVSARETAADGDAGFVLAGDGAVNDSPLTLRVEGGAFINIRRNRPYDFTAVVEGAGSKLTADGSITRPFDLGQFTATLGLQGRDLNDLFLLTGVALPNTPPYRLSGALKRDDAVWTFNDFDGRVGASDLSGDLTVNAAGRLRVDAKLASRRLDIDDLVAILGGETQTNAAGTNTTAVSAGAGAGKLLPDAPLQVERLRSMDGTLSYRAASVKANDLDISQVALGADLDAGILTLDPVEFTFDRGTLAGSAQINAKGQSPYSNADFRLTGYPLQSVVPPQNGTVPISGVLNGRLKLEGSGNSMHAFADNSKGTISAVIRQGQMRAAFAELLGINAGAGLLKLLSGDTSNSMIKCGVAGFDVANGIATARTAVIDTDVVQAKISGTIDLGAETLNLKVDGDSKRPRLLRLWTPITVTGPITAPRPGIDVGSAAAQVGVVGVLAAAVAPVAALLGFIEPGLAEDADCGALTAQAR